MTRKSGDLPNAITLTACEGRAGNGNVRRGGFRCSTGFSPPDDLHHARLSPGF
ncbi:hypothetical protein [Paracoccus fontiphilus]|uniref:Uncharacterized protein n=1 Tax=Paracoccus fontiphilus TaxID=1815556 RepID=A0ABV7IJB0_9RHOB